MTQGDSCDVHAKTEKAKVNGPAKKRLWGAINFESVWDEPGPAVVPPPLTVTATDSTTGLRPLIQRVPRAPPDVASSRLWWHGLCALECVCVMSEAWPGLWNIIYLVEPGFTLMVCSSVAVVKITIVNWMKYPGYDVHMMLRERERVREWITQSACVRACRVWLLRDRMHVCVSEGCPLLLVTKRQHRTARTEVFPDTWHSHMNWSDVLLPYLLVVWLYAHNVYCVWRCEHAMFCVKILMYKISLIHSCLYVYKWYMYINAICNFMFTLQQLSKDWLLDRFLTEPKLQSL